MENTNAFQIPESNLEGLRQKLAKLVRKATKLGLEPPTMSVGDFKDVPQKDDETGELTGEVIRFFAVTIGGPKVSYKGWRFVATLEPIEGEVQIRAARGESVPVYFRNPKTCGDCDHCRLNRTRLETFVLQSEETGDYKQVGRNCLADFLGGNDLTQMAALAEIMWAANEEAAESEGGGFGGSWDCFSLESYLAFVAASIRKVGFLTKSKARELNGDFY